MSKTDDLEAVRTITEALKPFDAKDQERIIRWAKEKLGLPLTTQAFPQEKPREEDTPPTSQLHPPPSKKHVSDIKTFVGEKNPTKDTHFAATVAYYYKFEGPQDERKDFVSVKDLKDACRKTGRRLKNPGQTLRNALNLGLLDRTGKGSYSINTVGENLVAMTLPSDAAKKSTSRKRAPKRTTKKAASKKAEMQKSTKRK